MWTVTSSLLLACIISVNSDKLQDALDERNKLLRAGSDMMLGSDIILSDSEQKANETIMDLKLKELDNAFKYPEFFNYSRHFFEYKDAVKKTALYKIIQRMPKGAILHAHDTGILGPDYVLELTYWEDLYICYEGENMQFLFSLNVPTIPCQTKWQLLKEVRFTSGNVEKFDVELRKHFTLLVDDPHAVYTDINKVWTKLQNYFITTSGLMYYKPIWEQYFYDTLKAVREDNVMYIEIRSVLPHLYDLEGNVYDSIETAESYKKVLDRFMNDYRDFFGAKLIYAPLRMVNTETVADYIKIAKELKRKLPGFLAGFDLVGQEDLGVPTKEFLPVLVDAADELDYFFHAGETNWYGTSSDENLLDAIILKTKRLGHAFALIKHPVLMAEVSKRDIALEVNVLSNAVLKLVEDLRNHPLAAYLARGMPVVISSDDPGTWEADPLSHDFYVAFVAVASRHADLRVMKKLALNSLYYSTYPDKDKIVYEFEKRWTRFIDNGEFKDIITTKS